ncbi:MAG: bifunctional phosphopantothenoylcysteine decarboxylase/phosphopantothenate--cysteine ligase CoaBC [Deltaproteobacteria bacterium CG17_big_fil_post_rev_8_21_14_2_50_51_6]|nr:MAG: bifunctional phosphopantothenoylcysteine decarboxylase/phosphopantothenate--cysteine ligase CoaBC [Deltaproteobacteria bacterium CG17_big_fil_post_rev_8_21_14_2_50_51_6]
MGLRGKSIVVGVTGGIAAYKAAELVRLLVRQEAFVRVAMTANALHFVGPVTFEALTGQKVMYDMYGQEGTAMEHIRWGQEADLVVIAPATANFIAKYANGIADDFLTTMMLAASARILICPAMNTKMLLHPATRSNMDILAKRGVYIMAPGEGELACGTSGAGRLPEPEEIVEFVATVISKKDLEGLKIIVTAGPTIEPIDPVRFITNRSTGKMGYAIAGAAARRGAAVTLISGPTNIRSPLGVEIRSVRSALEMRSAVIECFSDCDMVIKAAAVSDYRPARFLEEKMKKGPGDLVLEMVKNPDILAEIGSLAEGETDGRKRVLVGFAAETHDLIEIARSKLNSKGLDMIVANDVSRKDAGFATETNLVKMLFREGGIEEPPLMSKTDVAELILDRAEAIRRKKLGLSR